MIIYILIFFFLLLTVAGIRVFLVGIGDIVLLHGVFCLLVLQTHFLNVLDSFTHRILFNTLIDAPKTIRPAELRHYVFCLWNVVNCA